MRHHSVVTTNELRTASKSIMVINCVIQFNLLRSDEKINILMGSTFSVLASVAILRSTVNDLVPEDVRSYIWSFTRRFSTEMTITIQESYEGSNNRLFHAAVTYLDAHTQALSNSALPQRLTVAKSDKVRNLVFGLERNSEILDTFQGVAIKWKYNTDVNSNGTQQIETRWYELKFHKMHAHMVKNNYLPHLLHMAKAFKDRNKIVRFHTVRYERWSSSKVNLTHPMTFDTLFMDGDLKEMVVTDLDRFRNGKDYYKKIGKVWKRGYLLYGPPGTGKSSLIAAMANYLNYDIYNLNLSAVHSDSALENLLLHLPSRSILVVEDIDCSVQLQNRESDKQSDGTKGPHPQVTLAALLNAIDGLLSCCGDEKITVFTTNYRDRIDPALLRPGRMDMHINLSYCTFSTFKQLAATYLEIISDDDLFSHIENLIGKVKVSPAEVAGELMKAKSSKTSLHDFIKFLESKESEEQSSVVAPPITSNVDENTPKEENNDKNPTRKNGSQGQLGSTNTARLANDLDSSSNHNEVKHPAAMKVGEYAINAELEPILEAIFSKHGDIAANTTLHSMQCRSSLLEIACGIIKKLQTTKLENLTQLQLKSMLSEVEDLESVKLDVGWLRKRLVEIDEAIRLNELKAIIYEKLSDTIFSNQLVKVTSNCDHKSLAEGLLLL